MVKFRGIEVSIISQFEIRKIPEFSPRETTDPFQNEGPTLHSNDNSVASCYVPIYPGSQIWLEYSVDGPHPPEAAYFFKMFHNGQVVTSWDCTAKQGYHGKTVYGIQHVGIDNFTGMPLARCQAFKFSPNDRDNVGLFDDCIEVRVYRIEHRQRIPLDSSMNCSHGLQNAENNQTDGLILVNGGLIGPDRPQRRYRYQLLDPSDEPYATIRFYYRDYEFLVEKNIATSPEKQAHLRRHEP